MKSDNSAKSRRHFSGETKWQILKEGRSTTLSVSEVCDHHQISPTQFYQWERTAERAARQATQGQPRGRKKLQAAAAARRTYWEQQRQGVSSTT